MKTNGVTMHVEVTVSIDPRGYTPQEFEHVTEAVADAVKRIRRAAEDVTVKS